MEHDKEIKEIAVLLARIEPFVQRYLDKMVDKHGATVTLSVSSDLATSMLAMCLLMIMRDHGDTDKFMKTMSRVIDAKVNAALDVRTHASSSTCQRLH